MGVVEYVCVRVWSKRGRCERRKTRALTVKTAGNLRNFSPLQLVKKLTREVCGYSDITVVKVWCTAHRLASTSL